MCLLAGRREKGQGGGGEVSLTMNPLAISYSFVWWVMANEISAIKTNRTILTVESHTCSTLELNSFNLDMINSCLPPPNFK